MTYTINHDGLKTLSSEMRKLKVNSTIAFLSGGVISIGSSIERLYRHGSVNVSVAVVMLLFFVIGGFFMFLLPYKRAASINRNVITQIEICEESCILSFSVDGLQDNDPICFNARNIEIVPPNRIESLFFKGRSLIVFCDSGKKAYFLDEFFDESPKILDQLDIKDRSPRYNKFLNWVFNEAKYLKRSIFYRVPITIVVLLVTVIATGIKLNISALGLLSVALLILLALVPMILYPLIRKAKLANHLIKGIKVDGDYCCLSYNNLFKNEEYCEECELNKIAIGEKEIYQERFFGSEKFMVLNVNERKFYLHGDLLCQYEPLFRSIRPTNPVF